MLKVKPNTLILITGLLWLMASIILLFRAFSWTYLLLQYELLFGILTAIFLASIKIKFVFKNLTINNIQRIKSINPINLSIWDFHLKKDKLLILLMIFIGIGLRSAPFIPKFVLFPIYLAVGIAMFYVWVLYLKTFLKEK